MRGPGPLALLPASGGNRARGQSGEQEDQVLGQRPNWTASLGLRAGEKGGSQDTARWGGQGDWGGQTSTGQHRKQEGL